LVEDRHAIDAAGDLAAVEQDLGNEGGEAVGLIDPTFETSVPIGGGAAEGWL
jgi:hypothetical protein